MSNTYRKVEYHCGCGQDYGSCKSPGTYYLKYIGVSDVYVLLQKPHIDEPVKVISYLDNEEIKAIVKILGSSDEELSGCSKDECEAINISIKS